MLPLLLGCVEYGTVKLEPADSGENFAEQVQSTTSVYAALNTYCPTPDANDCATGGDLTADCQALMTGIDSIREASLLQVIQAATGDVYTDVQDVAVAVGLGALDVGMIVDRNPHNEMLNLADGTNLQREMTETENRFLFGPELTAYIATGTEPQNTYECWTLYDDELGVSTTYGAQACVNGSCVTDARISDPSRSLTQEFMAPSDTLNVSAVGTVAFPKDGSYDLTKPLYAIDSLSYSVQEAYINVGEGNVEVY